jgi:hypothetical protein
MDLVPVLGNPFFLLKKPKADPDDIGLAVIDLPMTSAFSAPDISRNGGSCVPQTISPGNCAVSLRAISSATPSLPP